MPNGDVHFWHDLLTIDALGQLVASIGEPFRDVHFWHDLLTADTLGQLVGYTDGTTTASYTYGADGYRKTKTVNGKTTNHIWDGDQVAVNLGEARGKFYRAGSNILVGETMYSMGLCTHFTDGHGNTTRITVKWAEEDDPWLSYMDLYDYDAFGNQYETYVDEWSNPFQYCGEYYDEETGFTYLRARYYDPSIGRFISEDPVKDGANWYVYCNNDPVNAWDPRGFAAVAIRDFVSECAGGITNWNKWTKIATFKIDGTKLITDASGSNNNGGFHIWNENGRMMADDSDLNKFFNIAGTITAAAYYSKDEKLYFDISGTSIRGDIFSGHSYIEYTPLGGATDTYATHPDYEHLGTSNGMHKNHLVDRDLMESVNTAKYSQKITINQQKKMFDVINNPSNNKWSYLNNCTTFASKVFRSATGFNFDSNTPAIMHGRINILNEMRR